jgi:hypothetical protein
LLLSIAHTLENYELFFLIAEDFDDKMSVAKFCSAFADGQEIELAPEHVITFIASHFFEIDPSFLIQLPVATLELILSHDSLQIDSENSLFAFVISILDVCPDSAFLLEQIRFEYLDSDGIERFILWSFEHFDQIHDSLQLWKVLSIRLRLPVSPSIPSSRMARLMFLPSVDGSLDGIVSHLTRECGGNVHDRGIVDISSKSIFDTSTLYLPKHAADLQDTTYFASKNLPDQWLCYDFRTLRVRPTHYSIRPQSNNRFLRSWMLEGSLDGSLWIVLDQQKNNSTIDLSHPIGTFSVPHPVECRFIRLRQTGKNASQNDYVTLFAFEIFGQLIRNQQSKST